MTPARQVGRRVTHPARANLSAATNQTRARVFVHGRVPAGVEIGRAARTDSLRWRLLWGRGKAKRATGTRPPADQPLSRRRPCGETGARASSLTPTRGVWADTDGSLRRKTRLPTRALRIQTATPGGRADDAERRERRAPAGGHARARRVWAGRPPRTSRDGKRELAERRARLIESGSDAGGSP